MDLLFTIQESIFKLERLSCQKDNIKITTSFITKRLFEEQINDYSSCKTAKLNERGSKIFGVEISFNHYSNDIVIYDKTRACLNERFKVTMKDLKLHCRFRVNDNLHNNKPI